MKRIAYHVTRNIKAVLKSGVVKPMRMDSVYLLKDWRDASKYARLFGGNGAVKVEYDTKDVAKRFGGSGYAKGGCIVLKPGATGRVVGEISIKRRGKPVPKPPVLSLNGFIVLKPVCVPVSYDGRKAGGRNPRGRQLRIFDPKSKRTGYVLSDYQIPEIKKHLDCVLKWMQDQ
jgi:hypothetical protein